MNVPHPTDYQLNVMFIGGLINIATFLIAGSAHLLRYGIWIMIVTTLYMISTCGLWWTFVSFMPCSIFYITMGFPLIYWLLKRDEEVVGKW